jgi:DNA-directed RNA polymerase subunit RPC12/RpoP
MPARKSRSEARARAIAVFMESLDRVIPADESVPLRGSTFRDWEEQVGEVRRAVMPTVLEERAALEGNALVESGQAGRCPHCGSERVYLERQETSPEVLSPDGPVVFPRQHCRCRSCGRSFSPPGA